MEAPRPTNEMSPAEEPAQANAEAATPAGDDADASTLAAAGAGSEKPVPADAAAGTKKRGGGKDDDDDEHPERKRNRAAVRNYRARKKAYTAQLEEEVKQLRLQNFLLMRNFNGNEMDANSTALAANSLSSQPPIIIPGQQEKFAAQILALQQAQAPPAPQPNLLGLALNKALAPAATKVGQMQGQQQQVSGYQPVQPLPVNMMNLIKEQAAADARKQVASMGQQQAPPASQQQQIKQDPQQQELIKQLLESHQQPMGMLSLRQRLGGASPIELPNLGQRLGVANGGMNALLQQLGGGGNI